MGVETGGCPHTAIREDASMNLAAIEDMNRKFPHAELCFVESGGDNLAATFSPELADLTIYVIDVAEGEKIPRKGGPGITRSDLLVINKIDLAPLVGANLGVVGVVVHVVAAAGLSGASMSAPINCDDTITFRGEEQHLRVPIIRGKRPTVAEHLWAVPCPSLCNRCRC